MGTQNSIDKRRDRRIKTPNLTIELGLKGDSSYKNAEVINLCAGGLCFLTNFLIKPEELLFIEFQTRNKKIKLSGEVVRVSGREVGIKFTNTKEEIGYFIDCFNDEFNELGYGRLYSSDRPDIKKKQKDLNSLLDIETAERAEE
jgi:hypothetical protein